MKTDSLVSFLMGTIGFFFGAFLGGVDGLMTAVLTFMAIDYVTGMIAAWKDGKLSSRKGFIGLARKICILFLIAVGHMLDVYVIKGQAAFRTMVIFFFIANEGISILENCGRIGIPIPGKLKDVIENLRE